MKMKDILDAIRSLSCSQGFYGRLLGQLLWIEKTDPDQYAKIVAELESQNFKDPVDMVLYFES